MEKNLPAIPPKRYFTIGEVSDLCGVKPYVLRYWEQEFTQLRPMKRRGNRRYYQHHEVLLIRRIRDLLYEQGFTISGARNRLAEGGMQDAVSDTPFSDGEDLATDEAGAAERPVDERPTWAAAARVTAESRPVSMAANRPVAVDSLSVSVSPAADSVREELMSIRALLTI
jgi:DNA-binding transcriptional MerR regulator